MQSWASEELKYALPISVKTLAKSGSAAYFSSSLAHDCIDCIFFLSSSATIPDFAYVFTLMGRHRPQVRQVLASNANVPLDIIMSLCEDSDREVRNEVRKMFEAR